MTAVLALAFGTVLLPVTIAGLHRFGTIDRPNDRSSHVSPTPRGGGLALVLAGIAAVWIDNGPSIRDSWPLLAFVLLFGAVGLADDLRHGIGAAARAGACLVIAAVLFAPLVHPASVSPIFLVVATTVIVGFTNSFNFMDGINGISALHAVVYGVVLAVFASDQGAPDLLEASALALAGCGLAFLPWNLVRAKVFLGDVGSYAMGATSAALACWLVVEGAPVLPVLTVFLPYLADTGLTVLRRIARRERWWEAHREHAYQHLADIGWPHWQISVGVAVISAICGTCGLLSHQKPGSVQALLFIGAAGLALLYAICPVVYQHTDPA